MITALMPLKAHSERIPGKNFKNFADKPLFKWMIDVLLSVKRIDKIVINTDAQEVLIKHGLDIQNPKIELRHRKEELCGDFVSMNKILEDDINNLEGDAFLMTHVTNPLLSKQSIEKCLDLFFKRQEKDKRYDSLFTVTKHQTRFYDEHAKPINHDPNKLLRTQDLPAYFEENSCLYLFTRQSFQLTNARIGKFPLMQEIPKLEAVDIDTPDEWLIGEAIARHLREHSN